MHSIETPSTDQVSEAIDAAMDRIRDAFSANRTAGHRTARLLYGSTQLSMEDIELQLADVEDAARDAEMEAWTALYEALGMIRLNGDQD